MRLGQSTRRALKGAELNLETYGHTRGKYGDRDVGYCLLGSVRASTRNPLTRRRAYRALHRSITGRSIRGPVRTLVAEENDRRYWGGKVWALGVIRRALGEES